MEGIGIFKSASAGEGLPEKGNSAGENISTHDGLETVAYNFENAQVAERDCIEAEQRYITALKRRKGGEAIRESATREKIALLQTKARELQKVLNERTDHIEMITPHVLTESVLSVVVYAIFIANKEDITNFSPEQMQDVLKEFFVFSGINVSVLGFRYLKKAIKNVAAKGSMLINEARLGMLHNK